MTDNDGIRSSTDRPKSQYAAYIPERRSGRNRRKGFDRRSPIERRRGFERRVSLNHGEPYTIEHGDIFRK